MFAGIFTTSFNREAPCLTSPFPAAGFVLSSSGSRTSTANWQELNEQKKEVFAEAKGEGFDVKILKEIIKLRKQDQDERDERESLLDLYMRAMETAPPEKVAKAA